MDGEWHIRRELVRYARRTYERGYVAATDGNLSARLGAGRVLVTPSGCCLGEVEVASLVVVDLGGRPLSGRSKPTSELALHLKVYERRADVQAVVHAHPVYVNAFSFAGIEVDACAIPEAVVSLGRAPLTKYATPSSPEGAAVIQGLIEQHDALVLQRHGSLTVGRDIREAYMRLEKLEHAAHVSLLARQLGGVRPLSADELRRLAEVSERYGWKTAEHVQRQCAP